MRTLPISSPGRRTSTATTTARIIPTVTSRSSRDPLRLPEARTRPHRSCGARTRHRPRHLLHGWRPMGGRAGAFGWWQRRAGADRLRNAVRRVHRKASRRTPSSTTWWKPPAGFSPIASRVPPGTTIVGCVPRLRIAWRDHIGWNRTDAPRRRTHMLNAGSTPAPSGNTEQRARLRAIIDAFAGRRVLVVGDLIADEFIYSRWRSRVCRAKPQFDSALRRDRGRARCRQRSQQRCGTRCARAGRRHGRRGRRRPPDDWRLWPRRGHLTHRPGAPPHARQDPHPGWRHPLREAAGGAHRSRDRLAAVR